MTRSPRAYGSDRPSHFGGIQDETPIGAGVHIPNSQQQSSQYYPPDIVHADSEKKKTFTFSRKTIIIIVVVAVLVIGGLVGGLVGGLANRNKGGDSSNSSSDGQDSSGNSGSTPAQTSTDGIVTSSRTPTTRSTSSSRTTITTGTAASETDKSNENNSDNVYPTSVTFTIIGGGNGVSGLSPTPFPGFDEAISENTILTNGDFKSGNLDGWDDPDGCWTVMDDPSSTSPLQESTSDNDKIARNNADDLSGGKSCNLTQVVRGAGSGTFELSFLYGNYDSDDETWFYATAGSTESPKLLLAMQANPGFSRYVEWSKAAYSIRSDGDDFVVTFSAHSRTTVNDVAQVQLIKK